MELRISIEEKNALIQCQAEVRYKYTLKRIADTETMWSIVGNDNSFSIQSIQWKDKIIPYMVCKRICTSILC